jgi:hypothetical protein
MKLIRLIKTSLNETNSEISVGEHFSDNFAIQNALQQRDVLSPQLFNSILEVPSRRSSKPGGIEIQWVTSALGS